MRSSKLVLVAGSGVARAGALAKALHAASMVPSLAFTPEQALACVGLYDFRLVIADLPASGGDLEKLASGLRARTNVPLILVSRDSSLAAQSAADCVLPVETTCDEVAARALALLTISSSPTLATTLSWGPMELDLRRRAARWYWKPLRLTSIQFRMMEVLILAAGSMVTAQELARRVWGSGIVEDEDRIRAHVWRIRKLIEARPSAPEFLLTVRGEGFRLADYEIEDRGTGTIDLAQPDSRGADRERVNARV